MKFTKNSAASSGPSSSIGIMRFTDTQLGGPKIPPEAVVVFALIFGIAIAAFHFFA
ncbi:MAG TPA: preprotein translocase subunit Sec61beta [archaeon]|nr:preprotein translocase subunit Sec61beta [archaeon]